VTVFTQDQPFQWEGAWFRSLRHTKLGKWWRKRRELREQKATTQALIEHQGDLDRGAVREIMIEDMNRNPRPPGGRRVAPRPTMARQEGDRTNAKRFLGQTKYYPNVFKK